ncbi:MAG TPA: DEAD/DEAH box helicase family protein [Candidatus Nitrosopolaris sp.]|nr:DEAD/DEAH box helicase family protein [Candidatus Nitrosopolaris sp.]
MERPLFDYEKIIFDVLQSHSHVWIKKATGLGITEFMLRFMAWLCLKDNMLSASEMCIVTGPRIDLAIGLIDRMKRLFYDRGHVVFDNKETVIELNGVKIEAFPSHHLDAMRGLQNVSFILLDESDFFPPGQQQDARDVSERYIGKSNPYIVFVSTPNAPDGLFERIETEPEDTCLYKRLFLDYTYGIDKIYSPEEIEKSRVSPSFEREYNLKYLGRIGNVFHTNDIEAAIGKGNKYNPDPDPCTDSPEYPNYFYSSTIMKVIGIDAACGSIAFECVNGN